MATVGRMPTPTRELPKNNTNGRSGAPSASRSRKSASLSPYSGSRTSAGHISKTAKRPNCSAANAARNHTIADRPVLAMGRNRTLILRCPPCARQVKRTNRGGQFQPNLEFPVSSETMG